MSNEKPVELTEAETDEIRDAYTATTNPEILLRTVARLITARVIAAEQAGREDNALHDMCYVSGSKALEAREAAARREALLEAAEHFTARANAAHRDDLHMVSDTWDMAASDLRALAEPERDEEGGR